MKLAVPGGQQAMPGAAWLLWAGLLSALSLSPAAASRLGAQAASSSGALRAAAKRSGSGFWPFDMGGADDDSVLASDADLPVASSRGPTPDEDEALPLPPRHPAVVPNRKRLAALSIPVENSNPEAGGSWRRLPPSQPAAEHQQQQQHLAKPAIEFDLNPEDPLPPHAVMAAVPPAQRPKTLAMPQRAASERKAASELKANQPQMNPAERMRSQCINFASWVKNQGGDGNEVVRLFRGTCAPAVVAGVATNEYASMCDTMTGAVTKFAKDPNWSPVSVCQAVLRTFRESGVGSSPLEG